MVKAAPAPPAVDLQGAAKTYASGLQALQPVHLQVAAGEFVSLLGPSGCGKSTLLRLVAGLLSPSAGQVRVQGRVQGQKPDKADAGPRLAYVFQEPTLMPWATVQANVGLPLDLAHVPRARAQPLVQQALALVGLQDCARQLPRQLSGGMQMRVSIARALVTQPQLLLMDEPFGALDEITRNRLDAELQALWWARRADAAPLTVLFVTHSLHEAVFLSQRVLVMAAQPGRVVDEVAIPQPFPRAPEWRFSAEFSALAAQLQHSLLQASGEMAA